MKTRMHPSVILENIIASLGIIIIIFISILNSFFDNVDTTDFEEISKIISEVPSMGIVISCIIFFILILIFSIYFFFKWYNTYIYFNNDSFVVESGKLFKKKTTIHIKEIASVNIKQNIIEKLLKTANIKTILNTNDESNFKGRLVFKYTDALKIKNHILNKEEELTSFETLISFNLIDVFKHIFFNANIISLIILILVYIPIIITFLDEISIKNIIMIIIVTVIFVFSIIFKIIKTILNYYGFKAGRKDDSIKISHGLLTTYRYSIPINKINAVIIKRTVQARIFGYYLVEVVNAGMNETETEKTIISLYVKEEKLGFIFDKLLPEYQNNTAFYSQNKKAFVAYLISKIPLLLITIILSFYNVFCLLLIPSFILVAFIQYKFKKIGVDNKFIIIKNGFFEERITVLNFDKIELVAFEKNTSTLITKLWSVRVNIVGNLTNNSFKSGYFTKEEMQKIEINY